jgi:hypothetical protein
MSNFETLIGKLEHSNEWGFGDAFELLCDQTNILANAFDSGRTGFIKVSTALEDVWTTMEDSINKGKIRVRSGKAKDESGELEGLSGGLLLAKNPNIVVLDKKSFLSWYSRDKDKIVQYLSCADLKIHQEEFLDRLARKEPLKKPRPITNRAKMDRLREDYMSSTAKKFKDNPNLQFPAFKDDYGLKKLIRGSGLPENKRPKDSTLQRWVGMARKVSKVKPRIGRAGKSGKKA